MVLKVFPAEGRCGDAAAAQRPPAIRGAIRDRGTARVVRCHRPHLRLEFLDALVKGLISTGRESSCFFIWMNTSGCR